MNINPSSGDRRMSETLYRSAGSAISGEASSGENSRAMLDAWQAWQRQRGQRCGEVVSRLIACVKNGETRLDLRGLNLKTLPPCLPPHIEELDLERNSLSTLPAALPAPLRSLNIAHNEFSYLPDNLPNGLEILEVSSNRLVELPRALPPSLKMILAQDNQLLCLPETLPADLQYLNMEANRLSTLPESLPSSIEVIILTGNYLRLLPEVLPESLVELRLENNQIDVLPARLPRGLKDLLATGNELERLPDNLPDSLMNLDISENRITELPEQWPAELKVLRAGFNRLTAVPRNWPISLQSACLMGNEVTWLPEDIFSALHGAYLVIDGNPLNERAIACIRERCNGAAGTIPAQISFSTSRGTRPPIPESLPDVIARWYPSERRREAGAWEGVAGEPGADAFKAFLSSLRQSVNLGDPVFEGEVANWLSVLSRTPSLRSVTFEQAFDANSTCEDRLTLTFNTMQIARITDDVLTGKYDGRLPELVLRARQVFRHECLEAIAREKVKDLRSTEQIGVYLAYQVKLNQPLQLASPARSMRYFQTSGLAKGDLERAKTRVQENENKNFVSWLACWSPWQAVIERYDPDTYAHAQRARMRNVERNLESEMDARLGEFGLKTDADAKVLVGKAVFEAMELQVKIPMTVDFLAARGLSDLLDPAWPPVIHPS